MLVDMRKRVILLLTSLFVWLTFAFAQDVPVGVIVALKKGSPQELVSYLGEKVDLTIGDKAISADKVLAEGELTSFFTGKKVQSFDVNHQGKRGESSFIVGTLKTTGGTFRVNCFFRRLQNRYYIHQIRIDKTEQ